MYILVTDYLVPEEIVYNPISNQLPCLLNSTPFILLHLVFSVFREIEQNRSFMNQQYNSDHTVGSQGRPFESP